MVAKADVFLYFRNFIVFCPGFLSVLFPFLKTNCFNYRINNMTRHFLILFLPTSPSSIGLVQSSPIFISLLSSPISFVPSSPIFLPSSSSSIGLLSSSFDVPPPSANISPTSSTIQFYLCSNLLLQYLIYHLLFPFSRS